MPQRIDTIKETGSVDDEQRIKNYKYDDMTKNNNKVNTLFSWKKIPEDQKQLA